MKLQFLDKSTNNSTLINLTTSVLGSPAAQLVYESEDLSAHAHFLGPSLFDVLSPRRPIHALG